MTRVSDFRERYGQFALVAGASEGLGAEFCRQLAARGVNVLLVARRKEPLEALALELRGAGVEARPIALDLSRPGDLAALARDTAALDVGLVVRTARCST